MTRFNTPGEMSKPGNIEDGALKKLEKNLEIGRKLLSLPEEQTYVSVGETNQASGENQ